MSVSKYVKLEVHLVTWTHQAVSCINFDEYCTVRKNMNLSSFQMFKL